MIFKASFAFLFLWAVPLFVEALSFSPAKGIELRTAPLIGGPPWLPIHVKVVINDSYVFDYVPSNATSKETLFKLVTLQSVPAEARATFTGWKDAEDNLNTDEYVDRAQKFCEVYDKDLHLVYNNCWTFAFQILQHVRRIDKDT